MSGPRRERWLALGPVHIGMSLPFGLDRRIFRAPRRRGPAVQLPPDAGVPLPARRPVPADLERAARPLRDRAGSVRWYDSIDLGGGVVTPGVVDRRRHIDALCIPTDLRGMRCLEATAGDGFWSFEMERRGAAEVLSARLDTKNSDDGYGIAHDALGSRIARRRIAFGDLGPDAGVFDLIVVDDLLTGLRDPQRALDRLRAVANGPIHVIATFDPRLEGYGDACLAEFRRVSGGSWSMNTNTVKQMLAVAGFSEVTELGRIFDGAHAGRYEVALRAVPENSRRMQEPSRRLIEIR